MEGLINCPHSIFFFRGDVENFDMEQATNTLKDWYLVPLGRPVINPPSQKRSTIDIPGANGVLDLSNSLTHYPVFENRTGEMLFAVLNDVPGHDWNTIYTKIMKFLQGNEVKFFLEDDQKWFYQGQVWVSNWNSRSDGTWSEVTLSYDVQPYRRSIYASVDEWLWDPFNFETDVITSTVFSEIEVTSDESWEEHDFTGLIDMMPVMPEFRITAEEGHPIYAQVYNTDLKMDWTNVNKDSNGQGQPLVTGKTYYDCILCEVTPESQIKMRFRGRGTVSMIFRSGRL